MTSPTTPTDRLGLYIHWPYCARICPYCDFNVYKAANGDPDGMLAAMLKDLEQWRDRLGPRDLVSVHFGGGTPSLMAPKAIEAILAKADSLFGLAQAAEIGLEANPAERERLPDLAKAGINRLSLGVQALDDASLKALGRDHDAAAALDAIAVAQEHFDRVSFDVIYAREGQSPKDWAAELDRALGFGSGHLSLYQLTIEPGTAFEKKRDRGDLVPPEENVAAEMFEITQDLTAKAGLPAYEVSNHARTREDQSVHNRLYWEGADWIGIGPGAHSRIGRTATGGRQAATAVSRPVDYIEHVAREGAHTFEPLSVVEEAVERVMMGVRLVEDGLDPAAIGDPDQISKFLPQVQPLSDQGLVTRDDERIRLTYRGRLFADYVAQQLASAVSS
jgi:oxygen-independent coproporphyrinogen-3 oxidase